MMPILRRIGLVFTDTRDLVAYRLVLALPSHWSFVEPVWRFLLPYAGGLATVHIDNGLPISEGGNDAPSKDYARQVLRHLATFDPPTVLKLIALAQHDQARPGVEGEPAIWQRRIRNANAAPDHPHFQWGTWHECDARQLAECRETGKIAGFPGLETEVRPLYALPTTIRGGGEKRSRGLSILGHSMRN